MTRATIVWFVGAAVVGAVAGGLHLLRSQIGGAHTGIPLAVAAFGLTALAAAMLFHGVMTAAREQDALAGPDPLAEEDLQDHPGTPQTHVPEVHMTQVHMTQVQEQESEAPLAAPGAPERGAASAPGGDTAYAPEAVDPADEGPAVYTFRRGKPVSEKAARGNRPPRRDRPA